MAQLDTLLLHGAWGDQRNVCANILYMYMYVYGTLCGWIVPLHDPPMLKLFSWPTRLENQPGQLYVDILSIKAFSYGAGLV